MGCNFESVGSVGVVKGGSLLNRFSEDTHGERWLGASRYKVDSFGAVNREGEEESYKIVGKEIWFSSAVLNWLRGEIWTLNNSAEDQLWGWLRTILLTSSGSARPSIFDWYRRQPDCFRLSHFPGSGRCRLVEAAAVAVAVRIYIGRSRKST